MVPSGYLCAYSRQTLERKPFKGESITSCLYLILYCFRCIDSAIKRSSRPYVAAQRPNEVESRVICPRFHLRRGESEVTDNQQKTLSTRQEFFSLIQIIVNND